MSETIYEISLPFVYDEKWRKAYRNGRDDIPRLSSYQSPEGQPIPFIYKSLDFSGGQSVDTSEYPFFGLWSNEALNQKPQTITVHGYLRGEYYLQQRTAFLDALMIPTTDDSPGFFDHPLWGRFEVVVESYNIQESADENGQCEISLTLKRAGVPLGTRATILSPDDFIKPKDVALIAVEEFTQIKCDSVTLLQAFGQIKNLLLNGIGRIQAAQTKLNVLVNEITGISNLIAQGIQAPAELAMAFVNAVFSVTGALSSISESTEKVKKIFSDRDNKKVTVLSHLSASSLALPIETVTVKQTETKTATENLYRTVSLCASAELLMQMEDITLNEMVGYWALYTKLENCINLENPDVYKAVSEMRAAVSQNLKQTAMNNELKKNIAKPVPLLFLSHHLGCNDEKLRAMNVIEDSLLISGEVAYV
ncbi:MAG: DNA circularization N-terminal domain-containing protein [Treponema sp.]|jgi:prophage DNA circulation protein|nr:DNA circularization N-terminal domain-containing protein [Treponema sp.]